MYKSWREGHGVPQTLDPLSSSLSLSLSFSIRCGPPFSHSPSHPPSRRFCCVQPVHTRARPTRSTRPATGCRRSFPSIGTSRATVHSCRWIILLRSCSRKQKAAGSLHATGYRFFSVFLPLTATFRSSSFSFSSSLSLSFEKRLYTFLSAMQRDEARSPVPGSCLTHTDIPLNTYL